MNLKRTTKKELIEYMKKKIERNRKYMAECSDKNLHFYSSCVIGYSDLLDFLKEHTIEEFRYALSSVMEHCKQWGDTGWTPETPKEDLKTVDIWCTMCDSYCPVCKIPEIVGQLKADMGGNYEE